MPVRIENGDPLNEAWLLLHQTYDSIIKCEEQVFSNAKLSPQQYQVLRAIKYNPGGVTVTAVANFLDRKPHSVTAIVDRLTKKGLVKRIRDQNDRRAVRLTITPEGNKIYEQTDEPANELPVDILTCLTQKETITLVKVLKKVREKSFEFRNIKDKVVNIYTNTP